MKYSTTILAIAIIIIFNSCTKNDEKRPDEIQKFVSTFVAGHESKEVSATTNGSNERTRAIYWYKGNEVYLGSESNNSKGLGVFGIGNYSGTGNVFDVLTVGYEEVNGIKKARLWKNKIQQPLDIDENGSSVATGIFVAINETDIYISGYETNFTTQQTRAVYWQNGIKKYLAANNEDSYGYAITVDNGDVYIAGVQETQSMSRAVYWKNTNNIINLPINNQGSTDPIPKSQVANSIVVKNNKVYCAGYSTFDDVSGAPTEFKNATFWKDNLVNSISITNSVANAIAVDDIAITGYDNVYTAGYEYRGGNPTAAIWKNFGKQNSFEPVSINSSINAIYKTDKYFQKAGFFDGINATYWSTDDKRNILRNGSFTTYANAINVAIR